MGKNEEFGRKKTWFSLKIGFWVPWGMKIHLYLRGEVSFDFLVCHGVLLLIYVHHLKKKFRTRRTPFIEKIERRNLEKSTFSKKILKKFWRFRNFGDPEVAEISGGRVALHKITIFRVFNPETFLEKLAKLWSSDEVRLLAKSLTLYPSGDYLV